MWIKMDKTQRGADDHDLNVVNTYHDGKTYQMGEQLAGVFIREKWGHQVKQPSKKKEKDDGASDENKEEKDPPANKKDDKKGDKKKK